MIRDLNGCFSTAASLAKKLGVADSWVAGEEKYIPSQLWGSVCSTAGTIIARQAAEDDDLPNFVAGAAPLVAVKTGALPAKPNGVVLLLDERCISYPDLRPPAAAAAAIFDAAAAAAAIAAAAAAVAATAAAAADADAAAAAALPPRPPPPSLSSDSDYTEKLGGREKR